MTRTCRKLIKFLSMANWTSKTRKKLLASELTEPAGKIARLRALLPELLNAREAGHRSAELMAFLAAQGLEFPSVEAFRRALQRARKAGALQVVEDDGGKKPEPAAEARNSQPAPATAPAGNTRIVDGVAVIQPVRRDVRIDKNPNLDDLF